MGQTLFQRLFKGKEQVEYKYFNPAKAKIASTFSLDVIGLRDLMFTLVEIREYKRTINSKQLTFGDYVLLSRPIGKDDVWVRVRFMPVENPDSQLTHNVLILTKYDEMPYCKELDEVLRATTGVLDITDHDTELTETYWRPAIDGRSRLTSAYRADVSIIRDVNNDGKVEPQEVEKETIEYWDYSRITKDEAGQEFTQFLFVEMDEHSKMQTMWRGSEIDANRVTVL